MSLKPIAITMGDPAGIGPETILAAWEELDVAAKSRCFVVGHTSIFDRALKLVGKDIELNRLNSVDDPIVPSSINVLHSSETDVNQIELGKLSAVAGDAAYQAIVTAGQLAIRNKIAGIVTAPINKRALRLAHHDFPGHTELLADICGIDHVNMMLYLSQKHVPNSEVGLGVVHTTLHMSLKEAIESLSIDAILRTSSTITSFFNDLLENQTKSRQAKIGVAALNPHGGEQGLFGREEQELIAPAVEEGQSTGLPISGPHPCDTLMARAVAGEFDGVVAMYHDQGHIAFKLLQMHRSVNVTLGLPIVRTSPAHGTAFELAGTGKADYRGLLEAIEVADTLAQIRTSKTGSQ